MSPESTSNTRLTLDNTVPGTLTATLEAALSNGESVRLCFQLPRQKLSQTVQDVELAMWARVHAVADQILKAPKE